MGRNVGSLSHSADGKKSDPYRFCVYRFFPAGVRSVSIIYNYFKKFGYNTVVIGASFCNAAEVVLLYSRKNKAVTSGLIWSFLLPLVAGETNSSGLHLMERFPFASGLALCVSIVGGLAVRYSHQIFYAIQGFLCRRRTKLKKIVIIFTNLQHALGLMVEVGEPVDKEGFALFPPHQNKLLKSIKVERKKSLNAQVSFAPREHGQLMFSTYVYENRDGYTTTKTIGIPFLLVMGSETATCVVDDFGLYLNNLMIVLWSREEETLP